MRVLLLHNRYRAQGGEERAVRELCDLLGRRGHDAQLLERASESLSRGRATRALLRGGEHPAEVGDAVRAFGADVVHAHNLHPLFGYRALAAAGAAGARTVLHLHNFRLYCAIGVAYRDGAPCHECRGRNTLPGVLHRCRGGAGEAAIYAAGLSRQQRALLEHADVLAVLSEAHGALLREHGLPSEKVSVVPNFVTEWAPASRAAEGEYALVSGRLVPEKGFDTAVRATRAAGIPLVVAGAGPDEARLRSLAAGGEVTFAGWVDAAELAGLRAGAGVVLAPSRCEEACPYAVLDAIAAGVPVLASDRGGLPELVGPGAALPAEDLETWRTALEALWREPSGRRSRGEAALSTGRDRFGEDRAYAALRELYGWAL
jgi:glycosyltransferase involved in cell wall biosynthesis